MHIDGKTQILGIIGNPISHTASPNMQMAGFDALKLNYVYLPFLVQEAELPNAIAAIKALNIKGINVTVPYKEKVIPYLDELDASAVIMQAVNTIVNRGGKLIGYNTDGDGFIYDLVIKNKISLSNKVVTVIGAGGAAKAIAFSLIKYNLKELILLNRTKMRLIELKSMLEAKTKIKINFQTLASTDLKDYLSRSDIIINTTSLGMAPNTSETPIYDFSFVRKQQVFYDIIYKPALTYFLKQAQERDATILNGLGMLLGQGVLAFKLFTNCDPPVGIMKNALTKIFKV
ncbi:MAG: shikimate dehydrogenase [Candidatus Margulisiibacteriota bacterium]|jgi:shikimate dehydrogenase